MSTVTICENTLDPSTWVKHESVSDVSEFLFQRFEGRWPDTAHLYLEHVAQNSDITPYDQASVQRIAKIAGNFIVVIYPKEIATILLVVALVVAAVSVGLSFLLRPGVPKKPAVEASGNNQLGDRQNQARPNGRIPDIFGQVWATFDLLAVPYRTFISNIEYEHCFMCVGRGGYDFSTIDGFLQIRDDVTPLSQIDGAQAQVYGPGKNPNIGSTPDITIGTPFTEDFFNLQVFTQVNGQLLQAPNVSSFNQINYPGPVVKFRSPNIIETNTGADLTTAFNPGDFLYIGGQAANDSIAHDPASIQPPLNLGGIYPILSVTSTQVFLDSPSTINANWASLGAFSGGASNFESASIMANNPLWIGGNSGLPVPVEPFFINRPDLDEIWCNFVATQGSFKIDSSGQQYEVDSTIQVGVTPCDTSGTPTGGESIGTVTLKGSHTDKLSKGCTIKIAVTPGTGGVLVRAHRTSLAEIRGGWQNSDAVQWRDCYVLTGVCATGTVDLGDITTIQTIIKATPSALAIKERKLNGLVTRLVPVPSGGSLAASTNAADIICAMALDPYIGNLQAADVDVTEIYDVAGSGGDIETYFTPSTAPTDLNQFCYTFDDPNTSFEESIFDVATAIFCTAFRRNGILSISFEKQTYNSTLLFNHRNKVPLSETRTVTFGTLTGNDGIILDYIEPNAPNYPKQDSTVSLYFPTDLSATNPKRITAIGVRNLKQAMTLGWRYYWKLIAQNTVVQFDATEEAALLVQQDRILVADNTRSDTQDGEVLDQSSLLLTLSQNVIFLGGHTYSIFLQHPDETIENIPITAGPNPNQVVLSFAPTVACVIDPEKYARTTYMIVSNAVTQSAAYLVSEKTPKSGKIYEVKAVNYDDNYYQHDEDIVGSTAPVLSPCATPFVSILFRTIMPTRWGGGTGNSDGTGSFTIPAAGTGNTVVLCFMGDNITTVPRLNGVLSSGSSVSRGSSIYWWIGVTGSPTLFTWPGTAAPDYAIAYELTPCVYDVDAGNFGAVGSTESSTAVTGTAIDLFFALGTSYDLSPTPLYTGINTGWTLDYISPTFAVPGWSLSDTAIGAVGIFAAAPPGSHQAIFNYVGTSGIFGIVIVGFHV